MSIPDRQQAMVMTGPGAPVLTVDRPIDAPGPGSGAGQGQRLEPQLPRQRQSDGSAPRAAGRACR